MGYLLEFKSKPGAGFASVEGSIFILAELNAFFAAATAFLCSDGTEKAESHRQMFYMVPSQRFF